MPVSSILTLRSLTEFSTSRLADAWQDNQTLEDNDSKRADVQIVKKLTR